MKRKVSVRLDEATLARLDQAARRLGISRAKFVRQALRRAVQRTEIAEKVRLHEAGYCRFPPDAEAFDWPIDEEAWESL